MPGGEFSLFKTFVHLEDGPGASEVAVGDRFWEEIGAPADLQEGRLVTASHWRPLQNSVEEKNAALWPLGQGGGVGSCPLSRWERVGVRAGGGGGRATLLKPARPVTQRSPPGEAERGGRRGPHDLAGARPPSYANALAITRSAGTEHRPLAG